MQKLSSEEYREYHRYLFRDGGHQTEIDLRCCPSYQSFQMVLMPGWIPQTERNLTLFIVRIPPVTKMRLTWNRYKNLMRIRVQWMIYKWIEKSGEDKSQTYQRLKEALHCLNPKATPPRLPNYPGWEWAEFWGECLIEDNETWTALFRQNSEGRDFPVDIPQPNSNLPELVKIHDSIHINQFLSQLLK